jgi:hypothetical protein
VLARRFIDALSPAQRDELAFELGRRTLRSTSAQALRRALTPLSDGREIEFDLADTNMQPFDSLAENFVKPLGFRERSRLSDDVFEAKGAAMRALHRAMSRRGHYSQEGW